MQSYLSQKERESGVIPVLQQVDVMHAHAAAHVIPYRSVHELPQNSKVKKKAIPFKVPRQCPYYSES